MVADGLMKQIEHRIHTCYCILVRPAAADEAIILPPYHREGKETVAGWYAAFDAVPEAVKNRIVAVVCDGHRGLASIALWRRWVLQRCHFHLLARIQGRLSPGRFGRQSAAGKYLLSLVKEILEAPAGTDLYATLSRVEAFGWETRSPQLKLVLRGFVNWYEDYRAYLYHPELRLPTTNNTAEALIGLIEELCSRVRGFTTATAFEEWVAVVIKTHQKIRCAPAQRKEINRIARS